MKDIIDNKINSREFTFMELLKIEDLALNLAVETLNELTIHERMEFAREVKITASGETFGELFQKATIESLRSAFAQGLKEFMENAKVTSQGEPKTVTTFEPPTITEVVNDMPPIVPHDADEEDKKTTTFDTGSDAIGLPKGVKRIE
tara:strand:+ start:214 stop:654 length:441 start_codon:yes stop_codon:yes gene_type:complete